MDWDDLRFFVTVARHGTLSAAARELRVTQPTVGRRIGALEHRLGAKLFVRRPDGFVLTAAGAETLDHASRMEQDALAVERGLSGRDVGLRGTVRVTASEWMVTTVLAPLVRALLDRHPQLAIDLVADHRHLNLARREADLALRPRPFEHAAIVQRATVKLAFGLYAAHSYLAARGEPRPGDGRGHVLVAMTDDVGDVARGWLDTVLPGATRAVRTNGRDAMVVLATAGVGIACLARVVGDQVGELERVPTSVPAPAPRLWLGVHRDAHAIPRVRAVASYLAAELRARQPALSPPD